MFRPFGSRAFLVMGKRACAASVSISVPRALVPDTSCCNGQGSLMGPNSRPRSTPISFLVLIVVTILRGEMLF